MDSLSRNRYARVAVIGSQLRHLAGYRMAGPVARPYRRQGEPVAVDAFLSTHPPTIGARSVMRKAKWQIGREYSFVTAKQLQRGVHTSVRQLEFRDFIDRHTKSQICRPN